MYHIQHHVDDGICAVELAIFHTTASVNSVVKNDLLSIIQRIDRSFSQIETTYFESKLICLNSKPKLTLGVLEARLKFGGENFQ